MRETRASHKDFARKMAKTQRDDALDRIIKGNAMVVHTTNENYVCSKNLKATSQRLSQRKDAGNET